MVSDLTERLRTYAADEPEWTSGHKVMTEAADEIDRLTAALAEARDKALEEAAKWHDDQILALEARIEENNEFCTTHSVDVSGANNYCRDLQTSHRLSSAAIRALKEKP